MTKKSPFLVYEEFISPLECEEAIKNLSVEFPDILDDNTPTLTTRPNRLLEMRCTDALQDVMQDVNGHYSVNFERVLPFKCEWYPEGCGGIEPVCDNSVFLKNKGKWTKVNNHDFTGIIFLSQYVDGKNIDPRYECYGGEVEFPNFHFSFRPVRGTLIIFPSGPNFINYTKPPILGDAFQVRFHIAVQNRYNFELSNFPGDYTSWFE